MWRLGLLLSAAGCGRLGFDARSVAGDGGHEIEVDSAFAPTTDAPQSAVTVTIGACPGADTPGAIIDTSLDNSVPDQNCGARREMRVANMGGRVSLVSFDLTAIPTTATVFSATFDVSVVDDSLEAGDVNFYPLREDWTEGTGDFDVGVSNWTMRKAGVDWSTVGAGAPGSRTDQVIGTFTARTQDHYLVPLDANVVQGWVTNPTTNFGMELATVGDMNQGAWLATREWADPTQRPCIIVTYVP